MIQINSTLYCTKSNLDVGPFGNDLVSEILVKVATAFFKLFFREEMTDNENVLRMLTHSNENVLQCW